MVERRPFIDCGFAILKVNEDESVTLYEHKLFSRDRQVETEIVLDQGNFIILPMTTGALMRKPKAEDQKPPKELTKANGTKLTKTFTGVIEDIFRKFDLFIGKELSYEEFKVLYQCTGRDLTAQQFKQNFLEKYCCT